MYGIVAKIETVLNVKSDKPENPNSPKVKDYVPASGVMNGDRRKTRPKLPKLEISEFDGNPVNWRGFWDQFKTTIHDDDELSTINKFTYLKSYLCQDAGDCIEGLTLSEGNYTRAIEILTERFGNTQILISSYMDILVKLPKISNIRELNALRNMYDKIEISVRNLNDLGVATNTYGSLLISILFERIPSELKLLISRKFKDENWTLEELLKIYKEELCARERCKAVGGGVNDERAPITGQTLFTDGSSRRNSYPNIPEHTRNSYPNTKQFSRPRCVFCGGDHRSGRCEIITEVLSRKEILRKQGRCYVCLQKAHTARNCKLEYKCFNCNGRHNRSI